MAPHSPPNDTNWNSSLHLVKSSRRTLTILAIIHFASWATCLVLGITAIWLRLQMTQGWEETFFGVTGISTWASIPVSKAT